MKKAIQKTAEATGDLIENKFSDKIARSAPRTSAQNISEAVQSKTYRGRMLKNNRNIYISRKKKANYDELRSI